MKKLFLALICVFGFLGLASCDEGTKAPAVKKTIVQYCGWDLGTEEEPTLRRLMIDKFNEQSETIRIEMVAPQGNYDEFLNTMAAGNALPDIFSTVSVPTSVINELAGDITAVAEADPEWVNVESALKESITYNSKVYAIPAAQNYLGFFANFDLIDDYATNLGDKTAEEVFVPGDFTTEQFFETIKQVKDVNVNNPDGTGVIGVNNTGDMINWLPSSLDESGKIKHFTWNGEKFDFTGPVMLDALRKIQEIGSKTSQYTFASFYDQAIVDETGEDPRIGIFGDGSENTVFMNGQMAFLQAATYYNLTNTNELNYKFIGYPDGKVVSAADFLCISKSCKNMEAAFEVAKFFTYGADGINARYEIIDADIAEKGEKSTMTLTGLPINTDLTVTEKWFDYVTLPGAKDVFSKVSEGKVEVIVEGLKTVPGFQQARFTHPTGISIEGVRGGQVLSVGDFIWDVCGGSITMDQYIANMTKAREDDINAIIKKAFDAISAL